MSLMTMQRIMYRFIYRNKSRMIGMLLLAPYLIGVAILILYPLSQTVIHSFTDTIDGEQFVGIQNFLSMKDSRAFQSAIGNSAIFYLISLPLMVILPPLPYMAPPIPATRLVIAVSLSRVPPSLLRDGIIPQ